MTRSSATANADTAARRIIAAARRGKPSMVTALEVHMDKLGTNQLRYVIAQLFIALADSYAAQGKAKDLDR